MATILAIETSSHVCSVSLLSDGEIIAIRETTEQNAHSKILTSMILEMIDEKKISKINIDAIAVSKGPGSYTGLRIGVSVAKGLCYGWSKPLIAVDTVKAQALDYKMNRMDLTTELLCPLFDARRMEVYTALYQSDVTEVLPVQAMIIDETSFEMYLKDNRILFFGTGAEKCKGTIRNANAEFIDGIIPSSAGVAYLAEEMYKKNDFVDVAYFEPNYLKDFIAGKPSKKIF